MIPLRPDAPICLVDLFATCAELSGASGANDDAGKHANVIKRLTAVIKKQIADGRFTEGPRRSNDGDTHLYPDWIRRARGR